MDEQTQQLPTFSYYIINVENMKHTHTNYVHKLYGNKLTKTTSTKFELQLQLSKSIQFNQFMMIAGGVNGFVK